MKSDLTRAAKLANAELARARSRFHRAQAWLESATQAAAVAAERLRQWETYTVEGSKAK